ncbi:MAG: DUF1285 domain-containing protein [Alphaproteobacteria bacterium]|nr:DUF1285 domain-containing protein [Alphaproteobacteria bacterium]MBF0249914.1 DUF1285 domain-containing protein [Alphaproteobacteria bacterium]
MGRRAPRGPDWRNFDDTACGAGLHLPEPLNGRSYRGALDIRIDRAGVWHYNGSAIRRPDMVRLFAASLMRAGDGRYWLVTPTEMGHITVEDAPFVTVSLKIVGEGDDQILRFTTNVDDVVTLCEDTPLIMRACRVSGVTTPYIRVRDGLEARVQRNHYYELVEHGAVMELDGEAVLGVWSEGCFFPMGAIADPDA